MNSYDIFYKMTKDQIIDWLKQNSLLRRFPTDADIIFQKYLSSCEKDRQRGDAHKEQEETDAMYKKYIQTQKEII